MTASIVRTPPFRPPQRPLLVQGVDGAPKLKLCAADGARAEVYLHGGHVTSWRPAGDGERLYLSPLAQFREGAAIRGGVPVIFPQFGPDGRLPRHGFARQMEWGLAHARQTPEGHATVTLQLTDTRASWALWRHRFVLALTVTVGADWLDIRLAVKNDGRKPFRYTAALHTYLAAEIERARVIGLDGVRYRDQVSATEHVGAGELAIQGELDRIYFDAPPILELREPTRRLRIERRGFPDCVVWNPGAERVAAFVDLPAEDYRRFVCIEPAVIGQPVWLNPGESWSGSQCLYSQDLGETPAVD